MNADKTRASLGAVVAGVLVVVGLLLAAPAGAGEPTASGGAVADPTSVGSGRAVALNGSVASGNGFAANHSTASGDAVAIDGSVASGCSFAANLSTASGGRCPAPQEKKVHKDHAVKHNVVDEAKAAPVTRVQKLAFTGPNVAPLVTTAAGLLAAGAALMALTSPRRRVVPTS